MSRKVTLAEGLREAAGNLTIVYICYALIQWEPNPLKWNPIVQYFAIFMSCIYFPYRDNQRWERDKDK
jgi:hypothetical protein